MSLLETLPKSKKAGVLYDYEAILKLLPHRYPFLFIDQVTALDAAAEIPTIECIKNVTFNEPYFMGHFPSQPVMPGVIQIEVMAQAGCILALLTHEADTVGKSPAFMAVDGCRFRRPVRPGDQLRVSVKLNKFRRGILLFTGEIYCGEDLVCNTDFTATMV